MSPKYDNDRPEPDYEALMDSAGKNNFRPPNPGFRGGPRRIDFVNDYCNSPHSMPFVAVMESTDLTTDTNLVG